MRYRNSIFASLLKPISRRQFASSVAAHDADAYDKRFGSWDHLVTLIYCQLSGVTSLRGIAVGWNANSHHHYHLGSGPVARSTLADANHRRPPAVFAETFEALAREAEPRLRADGRRMVRLIDATPIPLEAVCRWARSNGRTRGMKMHVVYDPDADHPQRIAITASTVNDVEVGRAQPVEAGATYVFDKAYCDYAWWTRLDKSGAIFVTRPKKNARYQVTQPRLLPAAEGDGFTVLADADVCLAVQGKSRLDCPMRRVTVRREDGMVLEVITNDRARPAVEIAALYKARWQIELLFRWLKQHLLITRFIGRSENAVRLQILAAMIAFLLLRIAARASRSTLAPLRFAELVGQCLFVRKPISQIDKPPEVNASAPKPKYGPDQMELAYA
jgi:IS4 transposase